MTGQGFDRIARPGEGRGARRPAVFSSGAAPRAEPLAVRCSRCGATSALTAGDAVRAAVPLVLVAPWRRHPLFAVCPACRYRAWLAIVAA